jgi:ABC-type phosphate/phosphonate transport system permease subunit
MNRILIHLGRDCWLATYQGPHVTEIIDAFNTATVPTAFATAAPLPLVIAAMRNMNPGCRVQHWLSND